MISNPSRLKVCHIISGDLWAGAEVMAYHLLKGLRDFPDLELSAIVLNEEKLAEQIRRVGIPCHIIDESKLPFLQILLQMRNILKSNPVHILHAHRYKENILAYLVSKSTGDMKLISTQHGMPEDYEGKTRFINRLKLKLNFRVLSNTFHNVVAVAQDIKESLIKNYGFKENNIKVIHNGIALPQNFHDKKKLDLYVIGSAGRFFPVKDYPLLLEIAREISHSSNKIHFILAGEGPSLQHIQQLVHKYGLEKVFHLPGFVEDMGSFYKKLAMYLNTSLHEGIPMSILEAMAHGLPIIAPKVGGLREIITDGVDGYLVESRNPKDFAEKCLMLITNENERLTMGENAKKTIEENFSFQCMARNYHELYKELVL